jgi:hypothetical protein
MGSNFQPTEEREDVNFFSISTCCNLARLYNSHQKLFLKFQPRIYYITIILNVSQFWVTPVIFSKCGSVQVITKFLFSQEACSYNCIQFTICIYDEYNIYLRNFVSLSVDCQVSSVGRVPSVEKHYTDHFTPRIFVMPLRCGYNSKCLPPNYKKFWEELIAYFPLIRHGLQRKPQN